MFYHNYVLGFTVILVAIFVLVRSTPPPPTPLLFMQHFCPSYHTPSFMLCSPASDWDMLHGKHFRVVGFSENVSNLTIFNVVSQKSGDQAHLLHAAVVILILILTIWCGPDDPFQNGLRNKNGIIDYLKGYIYYSGGIMQKKTQKRSVWGGGRGERHLLDRML